MRFASAPDLTPALTPALTHAPEGAARGHVPAAAVMEIVTFRLLADTDEPDFLAAARATAPLVSAQAGFGHRHLLRDETGEWTDMIHWQSLDMAQNAARAVMADPGFGSFAAMIDMASVALRHLPVRWQMGD